ncbi:hypothetical protein TYRP_013987 [Tyrophagus putrescentiae]|nr:hypothetical protein TYRP_013987 [Tyrophagus putrescentiae]
MSVSVPDLNTDFLPLIYEIIRSIEKETQDNSSQQKMMLMQQPSSSDVNAKMQQLKELFSEFRATVPKVPGVSTSKEEQLQLLMSLRQQLIMKRELLMKYKNSSIFDNLAKQQQQLQRQYSGNSNGSQNGQ